MPGRDLQNLRQRATQSERAGAYHPVRLADPARTRMFRGNVVRAGPSDEADFTTAWYWVRQVDRNLAAANVRDYYTLKPGGWHVRALNPQEADTGPTGDGTHGIAIGTVVTVSWNRAESQWEIAVGAGGGGGGAAMLFGRIESSMGTTPPFAYTARVVLPDGSGGFGAPIGIDFDLYNTAEIGAGGTGVHEVPVGSIVAYWQDASVGTYFFDRSFYRGTY